VAGLSVHPLGSFSATSFLIGGKFAQTKDSIKKANVYFNVACNVFSSNALIPTSSTFAFPWLYSNQEEGFLFFLR